ncbi:porin family protein [soil metagenome]
MAFTHFWHQLHLHRKKISILFLLFLLGSGEAFSQKTVFQHNLPHHDAKRVHYGLYLAIHHARFRVQHSDSLVREMANGSPTRVNPKFFPGFGGGLVLNIRANDYMDVRFLPGVGFYSRVVEFAKLEQNPSQPEGLTVDQEVGSLFVELPLLLKYKSERRGNTRVYFVGGVRPGFDLTSKRKIAEEEGLRTIERDLTVEYGIGLDLFFPFFKFSPELRFSHGLMNVKMPDHNLYSNSIRRLSTHTVTLYFFFES